MNIIDIMVGNVLKVIPDVNDVWLNSNALAIVQSVTPNYKLIDNWGIVKANDYYCNIGLSGANKSLVTKILTTPILQQVEDKIPIFDSEEKSIFLPESGSSEGLKAHMKKSGISFGIMDQDELSKMVGESKSKGYKTGDMEFLSLLWDRKSLRSATVKRGLEYVRDPYVCMVASSTHSFIEYIPQTFFRQGLGNRIVWSYLDHMNMIIEEKPADFFVQKIEDDKKFYWHNDIIKHLVKLYSDSTHVILMTQEASDLWRKYDFECRKRWHSGGMKDVGGWEFQPINRFPLHALKAAMTYCMGDPMTLKLIDMKEPIVLMPNHMEYGINFMHNSENDFNILVAWKLAHAGKKVYAEDFTELAKTTIAQIKGKTKARVMLLYAFEEMVSAKNDYSKTQVIKRMEEIGLIEKVSKSALDKGTVEKIWPTGQHTNMLKAVIII